MEEGRAITDLNPVERAWSFAIIDSNSNYFSKFGKVSNMDQVRTLYKYYQEQPARDGKFRDLDSLNNDKLRKFYVISIEDTKGFSENGKIDLIVDSTGHDIAITYVGKDGMKLEISPKILKNNAELIKGLILDTNIESELDAAKILAPKNIDELVKEINKNDTVAMRSVEDAENRVKQYDNDESRVKVAKLSPKGKTADLEEREEIDTELKDNSDVPEEMYGDIRKICLENDLDPDDLKQTITVQNPEAVIDQIDNSKTNIKENGGEVTILRFKNKEVNSEADKIFMIQGGELLKKDERNDEKISDIMEKNKSNNVKIQDFEDTRLYDYKIELEKIKSEHEAEKAQIEENVSNLEITDSFTEEDRKNAKKSMLDELDENYVDEVTKVTAEFCPPRTPEIDKLEQATLDKIDSDKAEEKEEENEEKKEEENDYYDNMGKPLVPGKRE